jgi:hypothetical protein
LPALARKAGLKEVKFETFAVTTPYEFQSMAMAGTLAKAVEKGIVTSAEVEEWFAEQASVHASGDFFHFWMFVLASGMV